MDRRGFLIAGGLAATAAGLVGCSSSGSTSAKPNESLKFITYFLLGFGGIALFVGAFVILNTLSITVAQRSREFATLRTLGASRKQVMQSVVIEGLVVGLLASVIGLASGVGIAKDQQALVFEEFRQAGGDYLRKAEGTGLGLALAKRFVELHGGTIHVDSEPGRGATFAFILPERVLEAV